VEEVIERWGAVAETPEYLRAFSPTSSRTPTDFKKPDEAAPACSWYPMSGAKG